ncbi:MAG: serine/threonine protein kinase [Polyangiaceae bacterium]|nr:serine/threonine protein kinase [Polyangiaceae bacterium]
MASDGFHDRANERAQALVGRTVDDRYAIDRVIAMGGMGTVYLARHLKLKKRVALKVLHPDAEDHPELFLRFEREAQAGAQVSHPNVAAATDFGEAQDGTRYLVLEYVRGSTLRQVIDSDAPLSSLRAARIVRQLAAALGEIHKRGIVHRDLKPRNVMLGEGDFVKIVDFGLAKIDGARLSTMPRDDDESGGRLTGGGMIFGTVEYLAPEAAYGMDRVDHRADLYALGVIAFEMLSGKHPFEGAGELEAFAVQRTRPAPAISERAPGVSVPAALERVVQRLLEKDVGARYPSSAELIQDLDLALPDARFVPEPPPPSSDLVPSIPAPSLARLSSEARDEPLAPSRAAPRSVPPPLPRSVPPPLPRSVPPLPPSLPPEAGERREAWAGGTRKKRVPVGAIAAALIGGAAVLAIVAASEHEPAKAPGGAVTQGPSAALTTAEAMTATASAASTPASAAPAAPVSATPSAAVSVSSLPSASAASAPVDPAEITALAGELKGEAIDLALARGEKLLAAHADVLATKAGRAAVRKLLVTLAERGDERAGRVFEAVGSTQATAGPDLLYQMLESGGRSRWAVLAQRALEAPAVRARASAAALVAFDLRVAPCNEKIPLIDRAADEGDARAVLVLDVQARGCFKDGRKVDAAVGRLKKRLEAR